MWNKWVFSKGLLLSLFHLFKVIFCFLENSFKIHFKWVIYSPGKPLLTYPGRVNHILFCAIPLSRTFLHLTALQLFFMFVSLMGLWVPLSNNMINIIFLKWMNEWQNNVCVTLIFGCNAQAGWCELLQNVTELLETNSRYNITKKLQVMWFAHKRICVSLDPSSPHHSDTQHPAFCGCLTNVE